MGERAVRRSQSSSWGDPMQPATLLAGGSLFCQALPDDVQPPAGSEPIQDVLDRVWRAAHVDIPVLLVGPRNGLQRLVARTIHQYSARRNGPLVTAHVAALPPAMVHRELFGGLGPANTENHEPAAGSFEAADGGTLLIDEVSALTPTVQAQLLRCLENRSIISPDGRHDITVDVRVIAATACDLEAMVDADQFREDLYYGLTVLTICLPSDFGQQRHAALLWMRRLLEKLTGAGDGDRPGSDRVLDTRPHAALASDNALPEVASTLADLERIAVLRALEQHHGNRTRAAMALGISVRTLQRRLKRWQQPPDTQRAGD